MVTMRFAAKTIAGVLFAGWATVAVAAPSLQITGYELVRVARVNVTVYNYYYRANVRNTGSNALSVMAELNRFPPGVTATDGQVTFGDVPAGATGRSTDMFVLRHDRVRGAFNAARLGWRFMFVDEAATRLQGSPGAPALSAIADYLEPSPPYQLSQLSQDADGQRVLRTALDVSLRPDATIGQVNGALAVIGARIAASVAGRRDISILLPDPGSLPALESLAAQLRLQPGIETVGLSVLKRFDELPPSPAITAPTGVRPIQQHLAIRAHAAWNLLGLLRQPALQGQRPVFVISDFFGQGVPDTTVFGVNPLQRADFYNQAPNASGHGYSVLGVIAARYPRSGTSLASQATGLLPVGDLPVRAVDVSGLPDDQHYKKLAQVIKDLRATGRNVIVNESLGRCGTDICTTATAREAHVDAQKLIGAIRGGDASVDLSGSFLMFGSAGNNASNRPWDESGANRAAVNPQVGSFPLHDSATLTVINPADGEPITNLFGTAQELAKLPNLLTVEARRNFLAAASGLPPPSRTEVPPAPECLASYSALGGHVSAIGGQNVITAVGGTPTTDERAGVLVLDGPNQASGASYSQGTSFASPQAAAVAGWVWSLRPDLPAGQVRDIVRAASKPASTQSACDVRDTQAQPVVDVYSAALATDNPFFDQPGQSVNLGTATTAPVRKWLLDVASADLNGNLREDQPDGKFTQADILKFLKEFAARKGATDYSRYDLNGNGATGEPFARTDVGFISRFDLDGDLAWGTANLSIERNPVPVEEAVNTADITVLIYYAYSKLYTGNEYERTLLLAPYLERFNSNTLFLEAIELVAGPEQQIIRVGGMGSEPRDSVFTSLCSLGGSRGTPPFEGEPVTAAFVAGTEPIFYRPTNQSNRIAPQTPNAVNCSSFVATLPGTGRWWLNVAARTRNAGPPAEDNEYQLRIYLGEPDLAAGPDANLFTPPRRAQTQTIQYGPVLSPILDPTSPIPFVPAPGFPPGFRIRAFEFVPSL